MRNMSDYFDPYYVLCKGDGEPGDGLHKTMTYWWCVARLSASGLGIHDPDRLFPYHTLTDFRRSEDSLKGKFIGNYVRHRYAGTKNPEWAWCEGQDRMSRDQSIPLIAALGAWNKEGLKQYISRHALRGFLFTNNTRRNGSTPENHGQAYKVVDGKTYRRNYNWKIPDVTLFSFWAHMIRSAQATWLGLLLFIFDVQLVTQAINKVFLYGKNPGNSDDVNFQIPLMQAQYIMPTPWSLLAKWIYRFRSPDMLTVNDHYWREEVQEPPINELMSPLIHEYLIGKTTWQQIKKGWSL